MEILQICDGFTDSENMFKQIGINAFSDTPTESQNMNNDVGMDTLQEMKEKEQFFEVSALVHPTRLKYPPRMQACIKTETCCRNVIDRVRSSN